MGAAWLLRRMAARASASKRGAWARPALAKAQANLATELPAGGWGGVGGRDRGGEGATWQLSYLQAGGGREEGQGGDGPGGMMPSSPSSAAR